MENEKSLNGLLSTFFEKAEKCFGILIDKCGEDGVLDVHARMDSRYSTAPLMTVINADGDYESLYLNRVVRDNGNVLFIMEDDTYVEVCNVPPLSLINALREVSLSWGLDVNKIEYDVFNN